LTYIIAISSKTILKYAKEILEITATDPTSWEDLSSYAKMSSNKLIHAEKKGWEVCL